MVRLLAVETYLLLLVLAAGLDLRYFFLRILAILPFGLGIALIQPFLRPSFIESYTPYPLDLPLGLSITYEGLAFGSSLIAKFLVCITAVVLLSSTTRTERYGCSSRQDRHPKRIYSAPEYDGALSLPFLGCPEKNKDCTADQAL